MNRIDKRNLLRPHGRHRRSSWLLMVVSLALAVALPSAPAAAMESTSSTLGDRELQAALDGLVAAGAPGAILLDRHGSRTTRLVSGLANQTDGRPMQVTDRFRAGSQMKSFTAAIVLQLVQEGRIGLDDAVDALLPGVIPHGYGSGVTYLYPFSWAGGGLTSTVDDSARFFRALIGGELLSPAIMREMRKTIEVTDSDLPSRSGLGVAQWSPCGAAWGKSGNAPGYMVVTWISPDARHETVLMINDDPRSMGGPGMTVYYDVLARAFCRR